MTTLQQLELPPAPNKDEIWTISPTQLDAWFNCRFKWYLSYRGGWTAGPTPPSAKRGQMVHVFMDKFYTHFLNKPITPVEPEMPFVWYDTVQKEHPEFFETVADQAMFNWAFATFLRYIGFAEREDDFVPLAVEQELFVPTGLVFDNKEVYLHGFIDLIFDLAGDLGFTDHKSHNTDKGKWTFDMAYFDHQITFYGLVLHMLGYTPKHVFINSINTFEYKNVNEPDEKLFNRIPAPHTERQFLQYREELYETLTEMYSVSVYAKRRNKDCRFCGYREVCDMILRGRDPLPLLQMKHSKDLKPLQLEDPFLDTDTDED